MSIQLNDHMNSYEFPCELPSNGETITFKPFTTGQIKKLLVYENSDDPFIIDQALDDIINECVITEGFSIDNLILQDRFYLLLKIREKSKGDTYGYTYKCSCKTDNVGEVKISQLENKPMTIDYTPIQLTDSLSVKMKMITRGEQKQIHSLLGPARITLTQKAVESITASVAMSMDVFYADGVEDNDVSLDDKITFINDGLPSLGFELLKNWLNDNDFGIKFEVPIKCMGCGNEDVFAIPIDNFFD